MTSPLKIGLLDFASLRPEDLDTTAVEAKFPDARLWLNSTAAQVGERLAELDVAIVNKVTLDRSLLEQHPQLRLICLAATGTDNVDLEAARELGIAVCNIRAYCTPSVVQHVFALILSLTQHLQEYQDRVRNGDWSRAESFCLLDPPIRELDGKTLGLIGLGELGNGVAQVADAFGMRVIAAQRPGSASSSEPQRLPLQELLRQADIVSLHCPLNDETRHLIDAAALASMKADALLINTARGGLVDYDALLDALRNGVIGGAGIDVLEEEPPRAGHPLIEAQLPNLIVTPHIAWSGREARQRALDEILANIEAFAAGKPRNRVA